MLYGSPVEDGGDGAPVSQALAWDLVELEGEGPPRCHAALPESECHLMSRREFGVATQNERERTRPCDITDGRDWWRRWEDITTEER